MDEDSVKAPPRRGKWHLPAQGVLLLPFLPWKALLRFPAHLRERDFWLVQLGVFLVTGLHFAVEATLLLDPWWGFHHIPVILYIVPIAHASIRYGWEGGLLTSGWVSLLVVPSIVLWHRENFMWLAETLRVLVVVAVAITLASRVEREGSMRRRAEASEARWRTLFESAGDAILVYDGQGSILASNAAAAAFFGVTEGRGLAGQHVGTLMPSWKAYLPDPQQKGNSGTNRPVRLAIKRADGRQLPADVVVSSLPDGSGKGLFQALFRDATVQEARERDLRSLVHQITQAQEEERERIARELHDETLQALVLLARELETLAETSDLPESARGRLTKLVSLAAGAGEALRGFSRDLRPSILDDLGLVPAIDWLTEDLSRRTGLGAHFRAEGVSRRLSRPAELVLFRVAQEALRNIEKHAQATQVEAILSFGASRVTLTITDNGAGFSPPAHFEDFVSRGKLGLVGLKERVTLLGGTVGLHSAPGQGTLVRVDVPL